MYMYMCVYGGYLRFGEADMVFSHVFWVVLKQFQDIILDVV